MHPNSLQGAAPLPGTGLFTPPSTCTLSSSKEILPPALELESCLHHCQALCHCKSCWTLVPQFPTCKLRITIRLLWGLNKVQALTVTSSIGSVTLSQMRYNENNHTVGELTQTRVKFLWHLVNVRMKWHYSKTRCMFCCIIMIFLLWRSSCTPGEHCQHTQGKRYTMIFLHATAVKWDTYVWKCACLPTFSSSFSKKLKSVAGPGRIHSSSFRRKKKKPQSIGSHSINSKFKCFYPLWQNVLD